MNNDGKIYIPLGRFDMQHPKSIIHWQHNEILKMSKDEQMQHNIKAGYLDPNYVIHWPSSYGIEFV